MARFDYNLFVIGAGSGGVRAARMAAGFGAKVALCEERHWGGTCVHAGCIPKKLLFYGARFADDFEDARAYGWSVEGVRFDWATLLRNKDQELERLDGVYRQLLDAAGVERVEGRGVLVDAHTVEVLGRRFTAEKILIATGGRPLLPAVSGHEHLITSDDAFHLERLPERIAILGGGYIALEFASIFHALGVETSILYRGRLFLRGFDDDVRAFVAEEMRGRGIDLRFHFIPRRVEKHEGGLRVVSEEGEAVKADLVLAATGRVPNTQGLGLEKVGVALGERGAIVVDADLRTSVPSIFALGDVIDRVQLTPVALAEAMCFARSQFGGTPSRMDYESVPTAVFSIPSVATVGLTEAEARARGPVRIFQSTFRPLKHTVSGRDERMLMKLVVDAESDRVLGCHIVGPDAAEILQGFAVAVRHGLKKAQLDQTLGIHPTAAEELVTMRPPAEG